MANNFWEYFLAIEFELANTTRFVEFNEDNYETYSIEFARILLSASSEVDVLCKRLCLNIDSSLSPNEIHIDDYRRIITTKYTKLNTIEVLIPRYELTLKPWEEWKENNNNKNPSWWSDYNKVKHHRDDNFSKANLINAIDSVSGLFAIVLYLYRSENNEAKLFPNPQLLTLKRAPGKLLISGEYGLPDFSKIVF